MKLGMVHDKGQGIEGEMEVSMIMTHGMHV